MNVEIHQKLHLERLAQHLRTNRFGNAPNWPNELWDEIGSTNPRAAELAGEGAPEGVIVMARQQTAGRGRLGRTWVSPPDAGIYMSYLLRPLQSQLSNLATVTIATGVSVSQAIENVLGFQVGLKWVNDLILEDKKLGGILAEMVNRDGKLALVIGIGINVRFDEDTVPDDLKEKMIWLERYSNQPLDGNVLVAEVARCLELNYDSLLSGNAAPVLTEWKKRSVTIGKQVIATSGNTTYEGTAIDITDAGALVIKTENGKTVELSAGEISIRTSTGKYC